MNTAFPPLEDDGTEEAANRIVEYQKQACNKQDPTRLQRFTENEEARFTIASKPWMAPPIGGDPATPFYEPIRTDEPRVKLANRNEVAPIIESDVARLIGSTSEPSVIPTKPTTVVHRAAKKGELVLDDILRELGWIELLHKDADNTISYGTSWLLSGWENDYTDMKKGPAMVHGCDNMIPTGAPMAPPGLGLDPAMPPEAPPAARCGWNMLAEGGEKQEGGGYRFTGEVAQEMVEAGVGSSISQPGDLMFAATLHECPECKGPLTLRRALAEDGTQDAFGYELTEEKPLPKVFVQGYPDVDVFPIGAGRAIHGFMPEVTIECIVPIDWLMQRYEHARDVDGLSLSEMEDLGRWHPAGLEMWGYEGHSLYTDQKRWAAYRITIRQPFEHPKDDKKSEPLGRLMISANKVVLFNGPLLFEYEGTEGETKRIPRMRLFPFANKAQNNSVHGISTTSRLLAPQKALDAMFTQFQYDMAENGSPTLGLPKGANIEGQGDGLEGGDSQSAIPNHIIRFDADSGPPVVLGGEATHDAWQPFTAGIVEHMQRTTAQSQLDQGKAASGAPSASAQMYIGQRLDETRKPKGQRWAERLSALFSYMLECVCAVYTDRRQFKAIDALDNRTVRDFAGADLMGQTNVKVVTKPAHDTEAFQRQNTLELIPLGLVDLSTPRQKLRVAKKLGTADELDPEPNQQITDAQNEFLAFTIDDPRQNPVAKKRTDNHGMHYQAHLEDLRSPAGSALTRFWPLHEKATDGWYEQFEAMQMAEKRLKSPLAAPKPIIMTDVATGGPDIQSAIGRSDQYVQDQLLADNLKQLPKNVQERIEAIQMKMLEAYPEFQALTAPEDQEDARGLTIWLSHAEAHKWYEKEAVMALQPPPTDPAAGAPAGPGGPPAPDLSTGVAA